MQSAAMLSKCRWVKYYQVVIISCLLQILEGILAEGLMTLIAFKVQSHIAVRKLYGLCATVNRMYQFSTTTHGINRESTGITEHIQHALTCRIFLKQRTVITLVYKESRLLSTKPVYIELQAVLKGHIIIRTAINKAVLHIFHKRQRGLALVVHVVYTLTHYFYKLLGYLLATQVHTDAVCLHNRRAVVNIDNQSGQIVALAVNESISIVLWIIGNTDGLAHFQS